jgi:hypothetical protein
MFHPSFDASPCHAESTYNEAVEANPGSMLYQRVIGALHHHLASCAAQKRIVVIPDAAELR